jgi:hypothetical protein
MPSYHGRRISSVGLRMFSCSCFGRMVGYQEAIRLPRRDSSSEVGKCPEICKQLQSRLLTSSQRIEGETGFLSDRSVWVSDDLEARPVVWGEPFFHQLQLSRPKVLLIAISVPDLSR